ncbi:MAG: hypothetical protein ACOX8I_06495 [Bacillota bacterium]|jgi:hypothetical protein
MKKYFTLSRTLEWIGVIITIAYLLIEFNVKMLLFLVVGVTNIILALVIYKREKDVVDERNERAIYKSCKVGFSFMTIAALLLSIVNSPLFGNPIAKLDTGVILIGLWAIGNLSRNISEFIYRYSK